MNVSLELLLTVARNKEAYDVANVFVANDQSKLDVFKYAWNNTIANMEIEDSLRVEDKAKRAVEMAQSDYDVIS